MKAKIANGGHWLLVATVLHLTACLGGGPSGTDPDGPSGEAPPPPSGNRAPIISGAPDSFLLVDQQFDFQPNASDPDGDALTFSIQNRPAWATFNTTTGRLSGMPNSEDVGQFTGIAISVSDGHASAALGAFSLDVNQTALGSVTLSWTPPTTNADGSAISDLAGFRIYYGRSAGDLDEVVEIDNPGTSRFVVENLSPATWYFSMTSYKASGIESTRTTVGSKTVS